MSDPPPDADKVRELVAACVEALERGDRDPVTRLCGAEPELARLVRSHLGRLHDIGLVDDVLSRDTLESFGPYRVLERIGAGGMGTVWLAEQTEPVRRRLAIKVVKPGMDSEEVLARFQAERQALARLSHPHVARLFDAGMVPSGRPFFAMELVEGVPITQYADAHGLDTEERIRLLLPVCDAVQHAHQRGLIHRDLKPSNILVTEREGRAVPMVIDFGVAKALADDDLKRTLLTQQGRILGTLEYMSPEQAAESGDVDTRADVYSLGVVLYELFTGTLPLETSSLRLPPREVLRALSEIEPQAPSTRVSDIADGQAVAARRRTTPLALRRRLRGELDWIVLKALVKERDRRYPSVNALAEDLRRHLRGDTVSAVPPSRLYLLRKTIRRHRVAVALAATVFVGMAVALAGIGVGFGEARAQTALAEADLQEALDTIDQLLVRASQLRLKGVPKATEIEVAFRRDALSALERLCSRRPEDPVLRSRVARAMFDLADGLHLLTEDAEAIELAERARAAARTLEAERIANEAVLTAYGGACRLLLEIYTWSDEPEKAAAAGDEGLRIFTELRQRFPDKVSYPHLHASLMALYGRLCRRIGDDARHESFLLEALELRRELAARHPGDDAHFQELGQSLQLLAQLHRSRYYRSGDLSELQRASEYIEEQLEVVRGVAERDPSRDKRRHVAVGANIAANIDQQLGLTERAEQRCREARRILGELIEEYPDIAALRFEFATPTYNLAEMLSRRWNEEPELLGEVVDLLREGATQNRLAIAAFPENTMFKEWQRMILQLLQLALPFCEDTGDEAMAVTRELNEIPRNDRTETELANNRISVKRLRSALGQGR